MVGSVRRSCVRVRKVGRPHPIGTTNWSITKSRPHTYPNNNKQACVALWFGSIGPGFWQYGKGTHGWFGTAYAQPGEEGGGMDHETNMRLSTLATVIFLVAFLGVGTLWGLVVGEGEGGVGDDGDGEEEEGLGGVWAQRGGGYVELSAAKQRVGSVDGGLEGSLSVGAGAGATHFRIGDEEEAGAVVL